MKTIDEVLNLPESRWFTGDYGHGHLMLSLGLPHHEPSRKVLVAAADACWEKAIATPSIEQVKVYYPRASSLQYLPAVYREDAVSADFLARFLSIFDTHSRSDL